jgi:CRP-like cAMP-binding protein
MRVNRIQELERAAESYVLLADLAPAHLAKLMEVAEQRSFETDEIIFREGVKSENLFLIASGEVALEITTTPEKIVVQTLRAGDAMGWSALTENTITRFQARALTPVQTIAFDGAKLSAALEYDPRFGYEITKRLLALITDRIDRTRMQIVELHWNQ